MRITATLSAAALLLSMPAFAQQAPRPCGANELDQLTFWHHNDPARLAMIDQANADLEAITAQYAPGERSTYIIPVVFHIIHNYGPENISDDQVVDAVRILNEDYNRLNPDWDNVRAEFQGLVADVGIEFRLARRDPQGNCTKGITRTVSTLTNDGTQTMKNLIQWPRNKYLNIWVAASADGAAGYTQLPGNVANTPTADGIVILYNYVGAIGMGSPSRSRALTHEVGHWLNLRHTWGNTNTPGVDTNCNADDNVADTPNTIGWTTCNLSGTSCGSLDNVENYMEYSYCSKMFTTGQKTRMLAALTSSTAQRNQLITASNLDATGVLLDLGLCSAEFTSDVKVTCAGYEVTYSDLSFSGVSSRNWSFPGGEPAQANDSVVTVVYAQPGTYSVQLQVSDGTQTLTATANTAITVLPVPGTQPPIAEGFENTSALALPVWQVVNPQGDNTWQLTTAAAYSGSKSVRLVNSASMDGRSDELISETIDMSGYGQATLSFRYAYAKRTSTSNDALYLYVSGNCGADWSLRYILNGVQQLNTGGVTAASFVPNGPAQWGQAIVTNIQPASLTSQFRYKFEFVSNGGNNVYIDDINIDGLAVGIAERPAETLGLTVVPDPVEGAAQAWVALPASGPVRIDLVDMTGREVGVAHNGTLASGTRRIDLPVAGLRSGVYFVRMQQGDARTVTRFVVR
jgi:PKD repeat protein